MKVLVTGGTGFVGSAVVHAPTSGDVVRMKRMDDGPIAGYRRPG